MFENIVGHEKVKNILKKSLEENRIAGAYLFTGCKGVGKFTTAVEFSIQILGQKHRKLVEEFKHPDFFVVYPFLKKDTLIYGSLLKSINDNLQNSLKDKITPKERFNFFLNLFTFSGNENIPVDLVREIIIESNMKPYLGNKRVFVIRNVEMMRKESANTFLKILEEPPESTMFILTTDNLYSVIPTIISRCQIIKFGNLSKDDFFEIFKRLGYEEKRIKKSLDLFEGSISIDNSMEVMIDYHKMLEFFLEDDLDGLKKYFSEISKKNEEKYLLKVFLKILIKYFNKRIRENDDEILNEKYSSMVDELIDIEHDLKVNFRAEYILTHIFNLNQGIKDNVWKS